jgi:predicted glycosyltransferase
MFDYEWATVQHNVNCRLARAVVVPEAIAPERLHRYGAAAKLRRYPGLKEEYYLADFEPRTEVLDELGLDPAQPIIVVRTPPDVSLYHRFSNDLSLPCSSACVALRPWSCRGSRRSARSWLVPAASSCPSTRSTPSR